MRARTFVRLLVVGTAVASMMLAPVVTWPSSGRSPGETRSQPGQQLEAVELDRQPPNTVATETVRSGIAVEVKFCARS